MKRPRIGSETFAAPLTLAASDKAAMTFKGMAIVFGSPIDCYPPSIVAPGAFTKTLLENGSRIKILWQHDTWEPIGVPKLQETETGLAIEARLDRIPQGERVMAQIESGTLSDLSIGFDALKWTMIQPEAIPTLGKYGTSAEAMEKFAAMGEPVRILQEVRLWEVSVVTFGAQPAARIAMAAAPYRDLPVADVAWEPEAARARVRQWAAGNAERLSRAFLVSGAEG